MQTLNMNSRPQVVNDMVRFVASASSPAVAHALSYLQSLRRTAGKDLSQRREAAKNLKSSLTRFCRKTAEQEQNPEQDVDDMIHLTKLQNPGQNLEQAGIYS